MKWSREEVVWLRCLFPLGGTQSFMHWARSTGKPERRAEAIRQMAVKCGERCGTSNPLPCGQRTLRKWRSTCRECGTKYLARSQNSHYCTSTCRMKAHRRRWGTVPSVPRRHSEGISDEIMYAVEMAKRGVLVV